MKGDYSLTANELSNLSYNFNKLFAGPGYH